MKSAVSYPLRFLNGFLDRACALCGAVLAAQFPQFFGQYIQRLGGHLDEARLTVAAYEKAASALGLILEEYIEQHLTAGSEVFSASGNVIAGAVERLLQLERSFTALIESSTLSRWWVFLREAEWSIAVQTWRDFTPGFPTTMDGLIYAAAGLMLGWGLYTLVKAISRPIVKRICKSKSGLDQV